MAKSKARKEREHKVRQGKLDPSSMRGSWFGVNPVTKKTPTKKEKLEKENSKYKVIQFHG